MTSKVVSFQIAQGYIGHTYTYAPSVIAVCEDGSMWIVSLLSFQEQGVASDWKRLTPEPKQGNVEETHSYGTIEKPFA